MSTAIRDLKLAKKNGRDVYHLCAFRASAVPFRVKSVGRKYVTLESQHGEEVKVSVVGQEGPAVLVSGYSDGKLFLSEADYREYSAHSARVADLQKAAEAVRKMSRNEIAKNGQAKVKAALDALRDLEGVV